MSYYLFTSIIYLSFVCFQSEDMRFDPIMIAKCMQDIAKFCSDTQYGQAKVRCAFL